MTAKRCYSPQADGARSKRTRRYGLILAGFAIVAGAGAVGIGLFGARDASAAAITVYKSPLCECCGKWVDHVRENGFSVTVHEVENLDVVRAQNGVADNLASCHTAVVDGYTIEGHVPVTDIQRLLEERPEVDGLAAPGMPAGSPGMESSEREPYDVLAFTESGNAEVFTRH